jgi:hypothetical protein
MILRYVSRITLFFTITAVALGALWLAFVVGLVTGHYW